MITLIGTGHVFDLRKRLQREVLSRAPDVVCLELDPGRLQALLAKRRGAPGAAAGAPLAYRVLAEFQGRLAAEHGIAPGDELLAAFEAAQQARVPVELIDLDAQVAFRKLWQSMGLVERARLLGSAFVSMLLPRRMVEEQLEDMQRDYSTFFEELAKEFPTVKRVLIDDRNAHMAARVAGLRRQGRERIVAVVGDGHVDGMRELLGKEGWEVETLRLKDLRVAEPAPSAQATWSTTVDG
jgi:pheromone shutdown protein TraB